MSATQHTMLGWIEADWQVPVRVRGGMSTRAGGVSSAPWASMNFGDHVGDKPDDVATNRQQLMQQLQLPRDPAWLVQVHGVEVVDAAQLSAPVEADASWTDQAGVVAVVMTADCLPVLFCDPDRLEVAVAHAGWRGLAEGVLEQTVARFQNPARLQVWLGAAIGPEAFEVGGEVRETFVAHDPAATDAFRPHPEHRGKWLADIYQLARLRLQALGVTQISGGEHCTYQQADQFFSYRRDGQTGRMAALVWIEPVSE